MLLSREEYTTSCATRRSRRLRAAQRGVNLPQRPHYKSWIVLQLTRDAAAISSSSRQLHLFRDSVKLSASRASNNGIPKRSLRLKTSDERDESRPHVSRLCTHASPQWFTDCPSAETNAHLWHQRNSPIRACGTGSRSESKSHRDERSGFIRRRQIARFFRPYPPTLSCVNGDPSPQARDWAVSEGRQLNLVPTTAPQAESALKETSLAGMRKAPLVAPSSTLRRSTTTLRTFATRLASPDQRATILTS